MEEEELPVAKLWLEWHILGITLLHSPRRNFGSLLPFPRGRVFPRPNKGEYHQSLGWLANPPQGRSSVLIFFCFLFRFRNPMRKKSQVGRGDARRALQKCTSGNSMAFGNRHSFSLRLLLHCPTRCFSGSCFRSRTSLRC